MSVARRTTVLVASIVVLLLDAIPAWLLSVTTIYGQAGSTSVYAMTAFALAWFLIPLLAVLIGARVLVPSAVVAVLARIALQVGGGPRVQLYASSVLVAALLTALVALAARGVGARSLAVGVASGFALSVTLRVALGGTPPAWQAPWIGWPLVGIAAISLLGSVRAAPDVPSVPPRAWLGLGPVLALATMLTAAPLRAGVSVLPERPWALLLPVLGCAVGVVATRDRMPNLILRPALVALTALACLPRISEHGVHGLQPGWSSLAQAGAAIALGGLLGNVPEAVSTRTRRRAAAAWAGLVLLFFGCFLYAAVQAVSLPLSPEAVLVAASVLIAVLLPGGGDLTGGAWLAWLAVPVAILVALVGILRPLPAEPMAGEGLPIRLVSYNVHVGGVSQDGAYDPARIARLIGSQCPDVVWLSEVDRGWPVDGDHDALPGLARRLDMRYVYAPAAAPDWGDVVLSRYPIRVAEQRALPAAGAPTGAQALAVRIDLGQGDQLGLVGTHLQTLDDNTTVPVAQARVVAAMAERLRARGLPVVVTGDLNAAPGSRTLAPLDGTLSDGLARWRPVFTAPADRPTEQIDQLYVTPDLRVSDLRVPASTASDHRALAVTLDLS